MLYKLHNTVFVHESYDEDGSGISQVTAEFEPIGNWKKISSSGKASWEWRNTPEEWGYTGVLFYKVTEYEVK